jgi:hypothetical protein
MPARDLVVATSALLCLVGCRPRGPVNLCPRFEVAAEEARENESRELDPATWLGEMLPGFDRQHALPPEDLRDCRGRRVEAPVNTCDADLDADLDAPLSADAAPFPTRPLGADDLAFADREGGEFLIWAKARRYSDGEALGPVAFARWTARGASIISVGPLRAPADHTRLRLEPLAEGEVLVVEGDACPEGAPCRRVVRLLPYVDGHFVDPPVRLRGGGCAGPATFPLTADAEVALASGKLRRFRLQRSVVVKDGAAIVFEEVVVTDVDPRQESGAGTEFRRSSKERRLTYDPEGLIIDPGIWAEILLEDGSIRPSDFTATRAPASLPTRLSRRRSVDALRPVDVATLADPLVLLEVEVDRLDPPLLDLAPLRPGQVDVVGLGERLDLAEGHPQAPLLAAAEDLGRLVARALGDDRELVALILGLDEPEGAGDLVTHPQIEADPEDRHAVRLADADDLSPRAAADRDHLGLSQLALGDLAVDLKGLLRRLLVVAEDRRATDVDAEVIDAAPFGLDLRELLRGQAEATGAPEFDDGAEDRRRQDQTSEDSLKGTMRAHQRPRTLTRRAAGVNGRTG